MANVRNRKLLDLAHKVAVCTACGRYMLHGCEPAHENGIRAGKGFGIKSHDNRHAAMCHDCHVSYDQGNTMSKAEKAEMWNEAHKETFTLYWANGWLSVV